MYYLPCKHLLHNTIVVSYIMSYNVTKEGTKCKVYYYDRSSKLLLHFASLFNIIINYHTIHAKAQHQEARSR